MDQIDPTPPYADATAQMWREKVNPFFDHLTRRMVQPDAFMPQGMNGIKMDDPKLVKQMRAYIGDVKNKMSAAKHTALKIGEMRRDASLLNYGMQTGTDKAVSAIFPYQFWYTRSAKEWAMRVIDKPYILSNYARLNALIDKYDDELPTRLRGKIGMNIPFLPEWAGDAMYLDPMRQTFPFEVYKRPFDALHDDEVLVTNKAKQLIYDWMDSEEITQAQGKTAMRDQEGDVWERAWKQAKAETDERVENPIDLVNNMFGMSLPLQYAYQFAMGRQDEISKLPFTSLVQNLTSGMTPGGINLEAPIRKLAGVPVNTKWEDIAIDRELSNMATEGQFSVDDIQRAMIEKQGDAYTEAVRRAGVERAIKYTAATFAADLYPEGEQQQRSTAKLYSKAMKDYAAGDKSALKDFFAEHPEYSARTLSFVSDPEERMRTFLRSKLWTAYMALPDLDKRAVREQFGDLFNEAFLNKETRNYDAIGTEKLIAWNQALGMDKLAGTNVETVGGLKMPDAKVSKQYQEYQDAINEKFPGINDKLALYFNTPEERRAGLFPEIDEYYQFKNEYLAEHPDVIEHVTSDSSDLYGVPVDIQQTVYQYRALKGKAFPGIEEMQDAYFNMDKAGRRAYLAKHPELSSYWEWKRWYAAQFPQASPYIMSATSLANAIYPDGKYDGAVLEPAQINDALARQLAGYFYNGEEMGKGTRSELERLWRDSKTSLPFDVWLESVVKPTLALMGG